MEKEPIYSGNSLSSPTIIFAYLASVVALPRIGYSISDIVPQILGEYSNFMAEFESYVLLITFNRTEKLKVLLKCQSSECPVPRPLKILLVSLVPQQYFILGLPNFKVQVEAIEIT